KDYERHVWYLVCFYTFLQSHSGIAVCFFEMITQLYINTMHIVFPNCFLKDVDPCEVWCSQPVDILREYCNVIKIRIFWPLLFKSESNSLVGVFDVGDALEWVRYTGDVGILQKLEKLGDFGWIYLEIFFWFLNWFFLISQNSESMKQKGNEEFSQGNFDCAIMSYTRAIEFCPANHLLYGNRALCLILTRQYK
uniref:Uncharacterized protein n=1 Tax=Anas platyrhynchos platyrhynchos TaxID=8840 RepID=A0A493TEF8_ANAPP